jgi:hypothetical protein
MALVLRELSGLSHEEIAGVLDSSARAVKQTIFEARAALQECAEGRTMLCADVQRALSDGDGRVLRGRRMRAHVRSCRACRQFKTALAQRPADLAVLAPALPATAGAALLAHLLPGATAGLAASAGTAGGAGGGVAATVATKAAVVLVATATLAGTGTVVRDVVTAPDRGARPAAAARSAPRTRPASAPASLRPTTPNRLAGSVRPDRGGSHATVDRHASGPSRSAQAKARPATGALPAHASQQSQGAKGQAMGQAKRQAAAAHGRRAAPKAAKSHPVHPDAGRPPTASAPKARPTPPQRPAVATTPAPSAQPSGPQDPGRPADSTPPGSSGAHAVK